MEAAQLNSGDLACLIYKWVQVAAMIIWVGCHKDFSIAGLGLATYSTLALQTSIINKARLFRAIQCVVDSET